MQVFPRRRRPACDTPQMPVTRRWKAEAEDGWRRWDDEETALDDCFPDLGVAWLTSSAAAEAEAEGSGFDIEWGGFLTNHLSHGVYALWQLGAPAPLVSRYRALYVARLSRLPAPLPPPPPPASAALLLGQRREYAPLLSLYRGEVRALGVGGALAARLPRLLPGLAGAALHGLIHCGVAARRGQSWLVAEGLAYLHHSYLALPPEAVGGKGVVVGGDGDASSSTAADGSACGLGTVEDALARAGPIPAVASSGRFQRAMAGLYSDAASATRLRAASAELVQRLGLGHAPARGLGGAGAAARARPGEERRRRRGGPPLRRGRAPLRRLSQRLLPAARVHGGVGAATVAAVAAARRREGRRQGSGRCHRRDVLGPGLLGGTAARTLPPLRRRRRPDPCRRPGRGGGGDAGPGPGGGGAAQRACLQALRLRRGAARGSWRRRRAARGRSWPPRRRYGAPCCSRQCSWWRRRATSRGGARGSARRQQSILGQRRPACTNLA
jgi:hypothetical protein